MTEEGRQTTEGERRARRRGASRPSTAADHQAKERKTCHPSAGHPSADHPSADHPSANHPSADHPSATQATATNHQDHATQSEALRHQNPGGAAEDHRATRPLGFRVPSLCCAEDHQARPRADRTAEAQAHPPSATEQTSDQGTKPVPYSSELQEPGGLRVAEDQSPQRAGAQASLENRRNHRHLRWKARQHPGPHRHHRQRHPSRRPCRPCLR